MVRYMLVIIFVCSIGYLYFNQAWFRFEVCVPATIVNLTTTTTPTRMRNRSLYLTYIISAVPKRVNFTSTALQTRIPDFFDIYYKQSVSHNDSRIYKSVGIHAASLMLTYIDLWREITLKSDVDLADNDWIFLFEDDVDIVPQGILKIFYHKIYMQLSRTSSSRLLHELIEEGLRLATKDGILYLGTCGPIYTDNTTTLHSYANDIIQYRRGFYFCTHAIAYTKWRMKSIWNELSIFRLIHNDAGADIILRQWQRLSKIYPFSMAANIQWPPNTGHFGFFYQARGIFQSVIQG